MKFMTEQAYPCALAINRLKAEVRLGVSAEERAAPQEVEIDVRFYLPSPPAAATDDDGKYICYHSLGQKIHALCAQREYRLIEYLAHEIYRLLRGKVPEEVKLWVKLRKLHLPLSYMEGGASYSFTDLPAPAWVVPE